MKKRRLSIFAVPLLIFGVGLFSCSSADDAPSSDNNGGGSSSGNIQNVPDTPDSGKNNNSEPDNIKPDKPESGGNSGSNSGDNSGSSDNTGSGSGDNTGSGGNTGSGNNSGSGSTESTPTWKLVFEDNFEGDGTTPDSQYWTLAPKGDDTWNRHMSESYDQAFQKNGYLYLYGEMKDGEYLTGGVETRKKFDFTYGQVKCRARFLRQPKGNHTGIWMMPETQPEAWPRYGEIDIMEHLNDESKIYSTVHFWNSADDKDGSSQGTYQIDNSEFNVYGVVWDKESVTFTVNGNIVSTYKNENPDSDEFSYQYPFVNPFYLILSQSLGGEGTWEGPIDNSELPAIFQIDWIKVWQKN